MDGTCYGSTQSPMGFQKPSEVTTVQADPNLSILAFKDSLLSIQHDLKVIDAINDIRTPFSDEKISPRSLDGNVPVVENRNAKTSTDVPASTRNQPSQSTPSTPTLPEYQTHLVTHNIGDTKLASTFDDGSSPYRSFENRPQLCQWLNETENSNLTVTEILEKSNWEPDGSKTSSLPALASHLRELSKFYLFRFWDLKRGLGARIKVYQFRRYSFKGYLTGEWGVMSSRAVLFSGARRRSRIQGCSASHISVRG